MSLPALRVGRLTVGGGYVDQRGGLVVTVDDGKSVVHLTGDDLRRLQYHLAAVIADQAGRGMDSRVDPAAEVSPMPSPRPTGVSVP